jgi:hypothetical protein
MIQQFPRFLWPRTVDRLEFLVPERIVGLEERLDLIEQARPEIVESFDMRMDVSVCGDREQAIVPDPLCSLLPLFRFDDANEPDGQHTSDRHRTVHENQHVERIAILAERRWNEAEVVRKGNELP